MVRVINLGVIGAGWMGKMHSEAFLRFPLLFPIPGVKVNLKVIADVDEKIAAEVAGRYGYSSWTGDWREVVADDEVDVVDICVHNSLHRDIAVAAARARKHVICEKPLATNPAESQEMVREVEAAGVHHMVDFNYRHIPAVIYAKDLIDQGALGGIYHFRGLFAQDFAASPEFPMTWRFKSGTAGGGSLVTMGSHLIDLSRWLVGEIASVVALCQTVIGERIWPGGEKDTVEVEDIAELLFRFETGVTGCLVTNWVAYGRRCHLEFEINGSRGSLFFDSERMNELLFCDGLDPLDRRGFKTILIGEAHPYGVGFYLKTGMGIGLKESYMIQIYEFIRGLVNGHNPGPTFHDGWRVDQVIEAAYASAHERRWVELPPSRNMGGFGCGQRSADRCSLR